MIFFAARIAQPIRLDAQQHVQYLLHTALRAAIEMAFNPSITERDDVPKWIRGSLYGRGSLLLASSGFATSSSAIFGRRQPYLFERKIPYVIELPKCPQYS